MSLYIHIPFCKRKCFYCSFVVVVSQEQRIDLYLECLAKEAKKYKGYKINSIFIGGGTPTLLNNNQFKKLFKIIFDNFEVSDSAECTVEANPEGLYSSRIRLLKSLGVTRISLGVQTFNNTYLKALGRNHDCKTAVKTFRKIKQNGFDNVSIDLMYGFPEQTFEELKQDLKCFTQLGAEHISIYTLTLEKNSRFYTKKISLPDSQVLAEQYVVVAEFLEAAGYSQYEISNFAKSKKVSAHNINYWRGGEYVGLGVAAHSYLRGRRSWNVCKFKEYLAAFAQTKKCPNVCKGFEDLSAYEQFKDVVLFGLRMNKGVNLNKEEDRFGCSLSPNQQKKIDTFIKEGWLILEKGYLKTSARGRLVLDELCAQLV